VSSETPSRRGSRRSDPASPWGVGRSGGLGWRWGIRPLIVSDPALTAVIAAAALRRPTRPPVVAPRRVALLRALPGIGDLLCAVPALRALRATWPRAHVTLLGLPEAEWFVQRYGHLVDELLPVEGVTGLPEVQADRRRAQRFLQAARERRFDLALQAHGSGAVTNRLLTQLGAGHLVTAHVPGHWVPPGTTIHYPDAPEVVRVLRVVTAAGCRLSGMHLDLPVTPAERRAVARLLDDVGVAPGAYVCLHPGASRPSRRWPAERFAAIADRLTRHGLPVLVTGSAKERDLARTVRRHMRQRLRESARDLTGRTGVGTLAALYRQARLVVTNDTGASHVAAAVRAPSVVVSSSPDPWRWAPLDAARHVVVAGGAGGAGPVGPLRPSEFEARENEGGPEMSWPTVDAVSAAVDVQLTRWSRSR
jgi:ADP-heptose:LPS heptosyltransferase